MSDDDVLQGPTPDATTHTRRVIDLDNAGSQAEPDRIAMAAAYNQMGVALSRMPARSAMRRQRSTTR
jgi:hypothetical protein